MLRAAQYILGRAFWRVGLQFSGNSLGCSLTERRSPGYRRYLLNLVSELLDLNELLGLEGSQYLLGIGDAEMSELGSFEDIGGKLWGDGGYGFSPTSGTRAQALSVLTGRPWNDIRPNPLDSVEPTDWNASVPVALPFAGVAESEPAVERAMALLLRLGVPVIRVRRGLAPDPRWYQYLPWNTSTQPSYGRDCLEAAHAAQAGAGGAETLTFEALLESVQTTEEALASAARALVRRNAIILREVRLESDGDCRYLRYPAPGTIQDIQSLLFRSRTGLAVAGSLLGGGMNREPTLEHLTGFEPQIGWLHSLLRCLQDRNQCGTAFSTVASELLVAPMQTELLESIALGIAKITDSVGSKWIEYHQVLPGATSNPDTVQVVLRGFGLESRALKVYSIREPASIFGGIDSQANGLLRCLTTGKSLDGADCDPGNRQRCDFSNGSTSCRIDIPRTQSGQNLAPLFIVVADGSGRAIDAYLERRPVDTAITLTTQHYVGAKDLELLRTRIVEREPGQGDFPRYNALGLERNLPVPLENELIQDSDQFEDSFAYYLARAGEAATDLKSKIERANQDEINQATVEQRIENAQADAHERVEQICGEGATSCEVQKTTVTLGELNLLPETSEGMDCVTSPPTVGSCPECWNEMIALVQCSARGIVLALRPITVEDIPVPLVEAAQAGRLASLDFQQFGGEYRIQLLDVKNALVEFRSASASIQQVHDNIESEVSAKHAELRAMELDQAASVLSGLASVFNPANWVGKGGALGIVSSLFSAASVGCGAVAAELKQKAAKLTFLVELANKVASMEQASLTIEKATTNLKIGLERLSLLELEQKQQTNKADRLAQTAVTEYLGDADGAHLAAFRRMTLVSQIRARRALWRAKQMAFVARRALEMKLGVNLERESRPAVIGDPPATWVNDLFKIGVTAEPLDPAMIPSDSLGGYLQRLSDFLYNYPFQYPFADGIDTAVLSLRDDLSQFDRACYTPDPDARNLIPDSEDAGRFVVTRSADEDRKPFSEAELNLNREWDPSGVERITADEVSFTCQSADCVTVSSETLLVAPILQSQRYSGSIHAKAVERKAAVPDLAVSLVAEGRCRDDLREVVWSQQRTVISPFSGLARNWRRIDVNLEVSPPVDSGQPCAGGILTTLRLDLRPALDRRPGSLDDSVAEWPVMADYVLFGLQIEVGESTEYQRTPVLVPTGDCQSAVVPDPVTGEERLIEYVPPEERMARLRDSFAVKCVQDSAASASRTAEQCAYLGGVDYYERVFDISLAAIESGELVSQGQISGGNYNYRIDRLAINLVGSNVKDCALDPGAGTSCFANLFIPYDLEHDGQVLVRDHSGVELPFKMSIARIHQGKAAAAGRLLTSPVSSTDLSLVQQYEKQEFRGRPIQGSYVLRLHQTPSFRWSNVEDVQLYLHYRYWSAFANP